MDVGCEIADSGFDATVESAAVRQMSTQTHARGADSAVASLQREQIVDAERGVLIVGGDFLQTVHTTDASAIVAIARCQRRGRDCMHTCMASLPTLLIFHRLPLSVSSALYCSGAGPVNS